MRLTEQPCWGRCDAAICTACTLLQMPADYTGSFPAMELQLPAVEYIPIIVKGEVVGAEEFCPNRRSAGMHSPDASVGVDLQGVSAVAHAVDCAPASGQGEPLDLGNVATTAGAGVANISTRGASA